MEKGYIQVYTGDGKGKTTASMGLVLRALGSGMKVYFGQFLKNHRYSEIKSFENFPGSRQNFTQNNIFDKRSDNNSIHWLITI